MIIIPEIEKIVILTPKVATTSTKEAILKRYKHAMPLYRHMEASGVPLHYEKFQKVGMMMHPMKRLQSIYRFIHSFEDENAEKFNSDFCKLQLETVKKYSFEEWCLYNKVEFVSNSNPYYSVMYRCPENLKSQWYYLRPDMGTEIFKLDDENERHLFEKTLDIKLKTLNKTNKKVDVSYSDDLVKEMKRFHTWDFEQYEI